MKIFERKPIVIIRLSLLIFLLLFAYIENNPIVKLEARLGLSPSPIERLFGVKSLFSGMTEGVHQFVNLNFAASFKANPFAPLVLPFITYCCLFWWFPKIDSKNKEAIFFAVFALLSLIVNIVT